jgi:23S rRNA (cytidine1920-2'-O)/16S rRNA (cytidine1409-2'-O)-methyltransferase
MARRQRVDQLLLQRGLASDLQEAHIAIREGRVHGPDRRYEKPGEAVPIDLDLTVKPAGGRFVSRGGQKLDGALRDLDIHPLGLRCIDLGASTGGFTDCLLQHGAVRVLAVDVGRAQLHERLRRDPRVVSRESTDLRDLDPHTARALLGGDWGLIVADLSFISLAACLPAITTLLVPGAMAVLLVKPQFELPRHLVPPGGVVEDEELHQTALKSVLTRAEACGLLTQAIAPSRLAGADGNREIFIQLQRPQL